MTQRKVCLVGDFAVGKTSLFNRFVYNRFSEGYMSTIGVMVQRKVISIDGHDLALVLWDMQGGQDSSTIKESYLNGASGAIITCDLTRVGTILHCEGYANLLRRVNHNIHLLLAGNKADLVKPGHAHLSVVRQVAKQARLPLIFTSARNGEGVEPLFRVLGEMLLHVGKVS